MWGLKYQLPASNAEVFNATTSRSNEWPEKSSHSYGISSEKKQSCGGTEKSHTKTSYRKVAYRTTSLRKVNFMQKSRINHDKVPSRARVGFAVARVHFDSLLILYQARLTFVVLAPVLFPVLSWRFSRIQLSVCGFLEV